MKKYPLLKSQLGVFIECIRYPESTQYNEPFFFELPSDTDIDRLEEAWQIIFSKKSNFKIRFGQDEDGEPYQWCDAGMEIPVTRCNCTEKELKENILPAAVRPFNILSGEPLVRVTLYITEKSKYMLIDCHHTIMDGGSLTILLRQEINKAYLGEPVEEDYGMLSEAENEPSYCSSPEYKKAKLYFSGKFADTEFTSLSNEENIPGKMIVTSRFIDRQNLDLWCRENNISPNILFQAAFSYVMGTLSRQDQAAYGFAYHNRFNNLRRKSLGMFVNTLPVCIRLSKDMLLKDFFEMVKHERNETLENAIYPVSSFAEDNKKMPRVDFNFVAGSKVNIGLSLGDSFSKFEYLKRPVIQSDICAYIFSAGDDYEIRLDSSDKINDRKALDTAADAIQNCIYNMMKHPDAKLGKISVLSDTQRKEIISLSAGERTEYSSEKTWLDMFENQVRSHGDSVAVTDGKSSITYSQLDRESDAVAHYLVNHGVKPDDFVAVKMGRSKEFVTAVIGIQKAAAAYVPVDPEYPEDRIAYMIIDSEADVVITDELIAEILNSPDCPDFSVLAGSENNAYMIYTSGSTGKPKGVVIKQKNISACAAWVIPAFNLKYGDRNLLHPSFSFDASTFDLFYPLAAGCEIHILGEEIRKDPDAIVNYINDNRITGMTISTAMGMVLLNQYKLDLKYALLGGESLMPVRYKPEVLFNGYGPTEFTVASSYYIVNGDEVSNIPIGRPVPNTYSFICDKYGNLLPKGITGELCLVGPQISEGYWNRPEKTAEVFVDCPFMQDTKMYRTGDLARYNENGELEYLGRIDFQVKLRGFRIELGEIENRAASYPDVNQVVALVKKDQLVLYYTAGTAVDKESLRAFMAETLTEYMVPTAFMQLEQMPMTPGGKIDRKSLPEPETGCDEIIEPETEFEAKLLKIVKEQLKIDGFGVTGNLISLGMSSLSAMRLAVVISNQLSVNIKAADIMNNPTVRALAGIAEGNGREEISFVNTEKRDFYPITENQRGIYIDWEMNRNTTQYNMPSAYKFIGKNADKLAKAVEAAINAHGVLKTGFAVINGDIIQQPNGDSAAEVTVTYLTDEPDSDFFRSRIKPFDLFSDRLYRAEIYAFGDKVYLFLDIHHIICDGLSEAVLMQDIMSAYDGKSISAEKITAYDFAVYESRLTDSDLFTEAENYYNGLVSEATAVSYPDSAVNGSENHGSVEIYIDAEKINKACAENGVTPASFLNAAFAETLSRITREENPMYLTISNGRDADTRLSDSVGMFVKTLPVVLQTKNHGKETVSEYVKSFHRQLQHTIKNDFYPYTKIVEKYGLKGEIIFIYQGGVMGSGLLPEGTESIHLSLDTVKMPVAATVYPDNGRLVINIEYDRERYSADDMKMLAEAFGNIALNMTSHNIIGEVPAVSDENLKALIDFSAGEKIDYDHEVTWLDMFKNQVRSHGDAIAVVDSKSSITYSQLDRESDAAARYLINNGVKPNDFVAVKMGRVKEFFAAVIGIQKAAAAYVPIDPEYPEERIDYMTRDSGAGMVITEELFAEILSKEEGDGFTSLAKPDNYAYMIYTSGSTGKPKGVVIKQSCITACAAWLIPAFGLEHGKRNLHHPSFSFDASTLDIFYPLAAGCTVHILDENMRRDADAIAKYIEKNHITGMVASTAVGMLLLNQYNLDIEYIMLGGEKLMPVLHTPKKLFNGYGPTEFTVTSSWHIVDPDKDKDIPIGRPVPNSYSFICDKYGNLLPKGMTGELCLAGPQISEGYWNRPEKTAEVFVQCRFMPGAKMYRTGDLARYNDDRELEYLGRIDFQVKLRGFRIELGEVENRAASYPGISQVIAQVKKDQLVLYYTAESDTDKDSLKSYMAETLTEYMVPSVFMQLDKMPMTPGGKIDRKALPEPEIVRKDRQGCPPATPLEKKITKLIADVLNLGEVYADDNFFELGGSSLSAAKLVMQLKSEGYGIEYQDIFDYQNAMSMAAYIDGMRKSAVSSSPSVSNGNAAYGDESINELLKNNILENADKVTRKPLGDVLLTGATGFLGIHILRELLESDARHIICLIRNKTSQDLAGRMKLYLVYYFSNGYDEEFNGRLKLVEGDITSDNLSGLFEGIHIDTIINCAACVKHYAKDKSIEQINIEGVRNLIGLANEKNAKLIQISTTSVPGAHNEETYGINLAMGENRLFVVDDMNNQYIQSKYQAELLMLDAIGKGMRGKIIRVGNLTGRYSDGEFQMNMYTNAFMNGMRGFAYLGKCPISHSTDPMKFSPIDCTAKAVTLLAGTDDMFTAFNADSRYSFDEMKLIAALNRCGVEVNPIPDDEYYEYFYRVMGDPERNQRVSALLTNDRPDLHLVETDNKFTANVLYRLGFSWPFPDDAYLDRVITGLKTLGFFM